MEPISLDRADSLLLAWTDSGQRDEVAPVAAEPDPGENVSLSWKRPSGVGAGLWNTGNSCYVNAALQCLTYTPPLANYMLSLERKPTCHALRICMLCALQRHIAQALHHPGRVIQPVHALLAGFHRQKQEDAHEFLMFVLDAMQKGDLHSEEQGLVRQVFGGSWRSQIKCLQCGTTSDTFDPYLDITLDIKTARSVKQALTQSVQPEELSGENSYYCSVCLQKVPASKTLSLHTSSKVLIVVLKRFSHLTGEKIAKHVQYSEWLDMQPYMSEQKRGPLLYGLYAVLVHAGLSSHNGHYLSYIKAGDGHWHKMNDNKVTACDTSSVLAQDAYVLFYVQKRIHEKDGAAVSAGMEAKAPGSYDRDTMVTVAELQIDSCTEDVLSEKHAEGRHAEHITLDEWKLLQEQKRTKAELNLRKVESSLPSNVVMIHGSKYAAELGNTPESVNFSPTDSARDITGQGSMSKDTVLCPGGSHRVPKKKKNKNKRGTRTVLVF